MIDTALFLSAGPVQEEPRQLYIPRGAGAVTLKHDQNTACYDWSCKRTIGEVLQLRRRPLLGPSAG